MSADHSYALISKQGASSENDYIGILKSHQAYADLRHFPSQQLVLNQLNYLVYDVPGDGNCFFSCLSLSIHEHFDMTRIYRELICSYIIQNWMAWEQKVLNGHGPRMNIETYSVHMLYGRSWATAAEVEVASILLDYNITIMLQCNNGFISQRFISVPTHSQCSDIELLLSYSHYRLMRKVVVESQTQNTVPSQFPIESEDESHVSNTTNKTKRLETNRKRKPDSESEIRIQTDSNTYSLSNPRKTRKQEITTTKQTSEIKRHDETETQSMCRKLGVQYECPEENETDKETKNRRRRNLYRINKQNKICFDTQQNIPDAPPLTSDIMFNKAMDSIRTFELGQMNYQIQSCIICHECRLEMNMSQENVCRRCFTDKQPVKFFSTKNNMNPGKLPKELQGMSIVEQQLISKISPCINVHMLKHGGVASSGHCVTFPQEINQSAQIFPRFPPEIEILKVRKKGRNDTSKDFRVRRHTVQNALIWLKQNNSVYSNITISQERLQQLPLDGEMPNIQTLEYTNSTTHQNDKGPANEQTDLGDIDGVTHSSVLLPDETFNLRDKVQNIVNEIVGDNHEEVTVNSRGTITIPWPTRGDVPVSEFVTSHFFTMAFPCLFPYGAGDFHVNRPRTCNYMADWAGHLLWFEDGRFANHQYFKFVVHNMILRKRAIENSNFIVNQKLGDAHISVSDIKKKLQDGDNSIAKKIIYLSSNLRGTAQYWAQKAKELRSLVQFNINEGNGLPSYFCTGSCAEFYFKPLRRILSQYIAKTKNIDVDLNDKSRLFEAIQDNGHLVGHYFDLRTQAYFREVMGPVFNVECYWYRQEFAKSRGMIHWHGLCWRKDREPHNLMHRALQEGLSDEECASRLAEWATNQLGLTASHPAGTDDSGNPRKDLWPPPEGSVPAPPEEKNPLVKLLMDASDNQDSLLEDYLHLTNRINIHRCSNYCLRQRKTGEVKYCRMEFGLLSSPGKELRSDPAIVRDKNRSLRLEMPRDHPLLVQHSRYHTQGWRANGDISVILSKSDPNNPSVDEILATEKYVTGYACKGNQPTGAVIDLFNDMINCADDSTGATAKSICSKLLIGTVKRDVSSVEASFELSGFALYRSSHTFQSVSFSGSRILDNSKGNTTLTKNNIIDKYVSRDENDKNSLYSFICKQGKVPVVNGYSSASWPLENDYCRIALLLHWPNWRKIEDIKPDEMSWTIKMENFLQSDICPNFVKAAIERSKHNMNNEEEDDNTSEIEDEVQPDWMEAIRPNANFSETLEEFKFDDGGSDYDWTLPSKDYPEDTATFIEKICEEHRAAEDNLNIPDVRIENFNPEQRLAFDIVVKTLLDHERNDEGFKPLRMVVTGTAGSGKSYLIKGLVKAVRTYYNTNKVVQVLCPTGNSANLISGVTIHSFLKIPIKTKSKEMTPPDGSKGEILQENCKNLKVLLVDERSLIGATTLGWMEFMCRCGMAGTSNFSQSWGGLPVVVFFGDDVQLPPVLDSPVYICKSQIPAAIHGILVWKEFTHTVALRTVVRQGNDENTFKQILTDLRQYNLSPQQAKWLQNFQWPNLSFSHGDDLLQRINERGLFVFPSHDEEWNHNKRKLLEANEENPVAKITAVGKGFHAKSMTSDKAGGLLPVVYICKGAKVMLTVNMCIPYGLFNGSMGRVEEIIYNTGDSPKTSLPKVVIVEFPNYTGPSFINNYSKLVPIVPVERRLDCNCHGCSRKTVPLRLGCATTIHRCQGMTIGEGEPNRYIVINPGTQNFESRNPGALFVALSRAKCSGNDTNDPGFAWHPSILVSEDRICHKVCTATTKARSVEIERLFHMAEQTAKLFAHLKHDHMISCFVTHILNDHVHSPTEE